METQDQGALQTEEQFMDSENTDSQQSNTITQCISMKVEKKQDIGKQQKSNNIIYMIIFTFIYLLVLGIGLYVIYDINKPKDDTTQNKEKYEITEYVLDNRDLNKAKNLRSSSGVKFSQRELSNYDFQTPLDQLKDRARRIEINGHRGGFKPDHTMRTFQTAVDNNLKRLEIDIEMSKDFIPMVIHPTYYGYLDEFLDEDGHKIEDWTAEELETIELSDQGDKIPRLSEVLQFAKENDVFLLIDIKGFRNEILGITVDLVQQYNMLDQVEFMSFFYSYITELQDILAERNIQQDIRLTKIYGRRDYTPSQAQTLTGDNISSVTIACSEYDRTTLNTLENSYPNIKINCWWYRSSWGSYNQESFQGYLRAIDRDIDAVTPDYPLVYRKLLEEIQNLEEEEESNECPWYLPSWLCRWLYG